MDTLKSAKSVDLIYITVNQCNSTWQYAHTSKQGIRASF